MLVSPRIAPRAIEGNEDSRGDSSSDRGSIARLGVQWGCRWACTGIGSVDSTSAPHHSLAMVVVTPTSRGGAMPKQPTLVASSSSLFRSLQSAYVVRSSGNANGRARTRNDRRRPWGKTLGALGMRGLTGQLTADLGGQELLHRVRERSGRRRSVTARERMPARACAA